MDLISQIVIAVLGGGLALAGVFLSNKLSEHSVDKRNQEQRLRDRGEELYNLFGKWATLIFTIHVGLYPVMRGEMSYNDYLDQSNNHVKVNGVDFQRMEFLIRAYFPELIDQYKLTRLVLEKHNQIVFEHKKAYKQNEDGHPFIKCFEGVYIKFEQESNLLKEQIIKKLSAIN